MEVTYAGIRAGSEHLSIRERSWAFGVAPLTTALLWWLGFVVVKRVYVGRYPHGGHSDAHALNAVAAVAAVPSVLAALWLISAERSSADRVRAVAEVGAILLFALFAGAAALFMFAVAQCPPDAYECPI